MELNRHFVLPRFLWTAQGKDGLKWVGLNAFEFLSQILKFSLKYETSNFVYKIRSRYIILHTHKQTITKFFFSEEKIQVLFSFRYT